VFLASPAELERDPIVLAGAEGRHAATVRRLAPGERADVTDGRGRLAECVVAAARPGALELAVQARRAQPPPQPRLVVAQALLKGDRSELAVEIMTEVGADEIVPWAAERCVVRWRPGRADRGGVGDRTGRADRAGRVLERWRVTAVQAAKQSRRAWFPEVSELADTAAVARRAAAAQLSVLLDPAAPRPLAGLALPSAGEIMLIVGPEGGVTEGEAGALAAAGAASARLGPSVLRGSSAGAVAAALVLSRSARWA
jgi:16S rRNA (uracil1498-N3)-methyltransferase